MTDSATNLGRTLWQARRDQKLSAYEVAQRTGLLHRATIQRIESGESTRPRPETLQSLAEVLELNLDDLLALAGYAKFDDLPDEAIAQLVGHFELIAEKYRATEDEEDKP
ncbi:MAG: helix-turn-helix transcriptional regulator [Acidimicrobiia bacterium]|nr:helix-turn-helix transcriptional regulator [Acidimicrobiia bacterium]MDQ3501674.1 helix-turn-helix domain-containing protein [Actinomycetota bacterium]